MLNSAKEQEVPSFDSYGPDQLTIEQARRHRHALNRQIDELVNFAEKYRTDKTLFDPLRQKFQSLVQQERLYRKYTRSLFSSSRRVTYPHSPPPPTQPIHHTAHGIASPLSNHAHDAAEIPDIPDHTMQTQSNSIHNNQNASTVHYHSDEEKCEHATPTKGPHHPNIPRTRTAPPNANHFESIPAPKSRDSRPYIEDEAIENGAVPLQATYNNVALLLFNEWPHPINADDLREKYWNYYKEALDVELDALDAMDNGLILKKQNTDARTFLHGQEDEKWNEEYYYYELSDIQSFFTSFEVDEQHALIREKVQSHLNEYHPHGLLITEVKKLFKYWIGPCLSGFPQEFQQALFDFLFDQYKDKQKDYVVMKSKQRPSFPIKQSWKVYALSARHMMICILSEKRRITLSQLQIDYRSYFGVNLDWNSYHNQSALMNLIDKDLFRGENVLSLSNESQTKHREWINWWRQNGISSASNKNNGANGAQDIRNSNTNTNRKLVVRNEYSKQSGYNNQYTNYNQQTWKGRRHDEGCLLYITGFPQHAEDPKQYLNAIAKDYGVTFNNFKPATFKIDRYGGPILCPIPVQTVDMAQKLILAGSLQLNAFPNRLRVRQYHSNWSDNNQQYADNQKEYNKSQRGGSGYQNNRGYNNNSQRMDYGFNRNDGRHQRRQRY